LELIEWHDKHTFRAPKEEASEEEKKLEESIGSKRQKLNYVPPEGNMDENAGPACRLRMTVSGGFYVRSLCYDLGLKLDSGAYMAELVRTKQGGFTMDTAVEWEDFVEGGKWEEKVVNVLKNPPSKATSEKHVQLEVEE
jgi:tRNA pseudouridine55 synthase